MSCPDPLPPFPGCIELPDCARMVMQYSCFGQTIENVFYFQRSGGYDGTALDDLNAAATTSWTANIRPHLPGAITLETITSTGTECVAPAQDIDVVGAAGSNVGAVFETTGQTFAIKFGTALAGRSYRGRMYWPVLMASEVNDAKLSAVFAGQIRSGVEDFFADILADTGDQHVIASYVHDCEWRDTGVATNVTSYSYTDLNLDSQRRRLPGRGI